MSRSFPPASPSSLLLPTIILPHTTCSFFSHPIPFRIFQHRPQFTDGVGIHSVRPYVNGVRDPSIHLPYEGEVVILRLTLDSLISTSAASDRNYHTCVIAQVVERENDCLVNGYVLAPSVWTSRPLLSSLIPALVALDPVWVDWVFKVLTVEPEAGAAGGDTPDDGTGHCGKKYTEDLSEVLVCYIADSFTPSFEAFDDEDEDNDGVSSCDMLVGGMLELFSPNDPYYRVRVARRRAERNEHLQQWLMAVPDGSD
ncbi:hypothetical protein K440DRAFT_640916 [Wilcoxina mikolae CBS 423.85]|nr:hypothetical protein K440DRAFT_640916 [Wilcoxina mikolae CBS 423.85]